MICPHCSTGVRFNWYVTKPMQRSPDNKIGIEIYYGDCPNCQKLVIGIQKGTLVSDPYTYDYKISKMEWNEVVYPKSNDFKNSNEIPIQYSQDYEEAIKVLSASPKASAALTRRLLQNILREEFNISEKSLAKEIEIFTNKTDIPSHITDAVDAVRQIGNIAAHPSKDLSTGEIVPVENGEEEWLIEVIEQLSILFLFNQKNWKKENKN